MSLYSGPTRRYLVRTWLENSQRRIAKNVAEHTDENFYRSLYRIRRVEEEIVRLYPSDRIKSPVHLSIGQESVSVGVCAALSANDIVFGTYRGHALYLAKGGDLNSMMAELYGKRDGSAEWLATSTSSPVVKFATGLEGVPLCGHVSQPGLQSTAASWLDL